MKVKAILFDIRSIQKYIFSGNKLRTNIGASHITANLFQKLLIDGVLKENSSWLGSVDTDSWRNLPEDFSALPTDCFVAQVGGGKALILLRPTEDKAADEEKMKNIVRLFNKRVLEEYPGVHTGAALGELDLSNFNASQDLLFRTLKNNQNTLYPLVNPPYSGVTHFCEATGKLADYRDSNHEIVTNRREKTRWFAGEILSKAQAAQESNDFLVETFNDECQGRAFPLEFDRLGQRESENYYAIVHIDGNKMGVRFRNCPNLASYNNLALAVQNRTVSSFGKLLEHISANYDRYVNIGELKLDGQTLPIRPLILGGDDVTFVCAAKVAVEFAVRYMRELIAPQQDSERIYTCAGIAILPTSYPFFRGYQMTEQLCGAAKGKSRGAGNSCWLDFGILHGEQAPTLEQIRRREYSGAQGNLHFGPYRVDTSEDAHSIDNLLACTDNLRREIDGRRRFPSNKLKEMRSVLAKDSHEIKRFLEQLRHEKIDLPHIKAWEAYEDELWASGETPYIDAIEMVDFTVSTAKGGA